VELALEEKLAEFHNQLSEVSKTSHEGMRHYLEVQARGTREEIDSALHRMREEALRGFSEELGRTIEAQIRSSAEAAAQQVREDREKLQADLKVTSGHLMAETERQLTDLRRATSETLGREAQAIAEQYRDELRRLGDYFRDRSTKEFEAALEGAAESQRAAILERISMDFEAVRQRHFGQLEDRAGQLTQESFDRLHKLVGSAALAVEQQIESACQRVEAAADKATERLRGEVAELSRALVDQVRREAEHVLDGFRGRLELAAHALGILMPPPSQPAAREEPEPRPPSPAPDPLFESLAEDLARRHEQAVQEAAETFRAKIAEVLAPFGDPSRQR
jgi:DNA anti-recombination protein RmuC